MSRSCSGLAAILLEQQRQLHFAPCETPAVAEIDPDVGRSETRADVASEGRPGGVDHACVRVGRGLDLDVIERTGIDDGARQDELRPRENRDPADNSTLARNHRRIARGFRSSTNTKKPR